MVADALPLRSTSCDLLTLADVPALGRILSGCIGADPGVQFGLAAAVLALPEGARMPLVRFLRVSTFGQRAVRSPKALACPARAPTYPEVLAEVREMAAPLRMLLGRAPAVACEDWFVGPNPAFVRDTARQVYYAQAAAEELGLRFRPVQHGTWKLHALGTASMKSADAARAYGRAAADMIGPGAPGERWCPPGGGSPTEVDDAAAACIAHWYLSTEAA